MKTPLIALTTDFGESDPFVGIMKGVISGIAPGVSLVDITHAIPPGDIQRGAIVLWQSAPYFPPGTVFLAVVDPGVGTKRKGIILYAQGRIFVGPDNGLFSYLLVEGENAQAWELADTLLGDLHSSAVDLQPSAVDLQPSAVNLQPSATFHGRDVFAPSAARAALGVKGAEFGEKCPHLARLPFPSLEVISTRELRGEIVTIDQFGNLLTSLGRFVPAEDEQLQLFPWLGQHLPMVKFSLDKARVLLPDGQSLPFVNTFAQVSPGNCAALIGSTGLIEIVANRQSSANILKLKRGSQISLKFT
ncbi:MAG: SAM-dependent chlorinase/fluorinase [Chloroflexota bacterium]|nr:SAM-dependent chlorinase/fluorinase [Chloroflexota bacterium]